MDDGESQCKQACRAYCLFSSPSPLLPPACDCLCFSVLISDKSSAPCGQQLAALPSSAVCMCLFVCLFFFFFWLVHAWLASVAPRCHWISHRNVWPFVVHVVDRLVLLLLSLSVVGGCVSSLQARVENEIFDYKDLAALPKVKAIYEVQQPDLISSSYQPYHRYTSDERLDTFTYGEVLLPHTCCLMNHCAVPICFPF